MVPKPGFTDFAIYLFDQNGVLDYVCQKLNEKQVEYIDLQRWGYINQGYKGSAIISAVFWEHDVFDPAGRFERNLVGLAAVSIERSSTRIGEDVPGDEAAGSRGIPFALADVIGENCLYSFTGIPARCPGVPGRPGNPFECPDEISVSCKDCPLQIPDGGFVQSRANVAVPPGCLVEKATLRLDIQHTAIGDLEVSLGKGSQPPGAVSFRTLFSGICGAANDVQAVLDDDAASPIGSVCAPTGFARYRSQGDTLTRFVGKSAAGEWILRIRDDEPFDTGRLQDYTLQVELRDAFGR